MDQKTLETVSLISKECKVVFLFAEDDEIFFDFSDMDIEPPAVVIDIDLNSLGINTQLSQRDQFYLTGLAIHLDYEVRMIVEKENCEKCQEEKEEEEHEGETV